MSIKRNHGKNWRSRLAVTSLIVCFLASSLATAKLKYIPMWERMTCGDVEAACYTFEQSQLILTVDLTFQVKDLSLANCFADLGDLKKIEFKLLTSLGLLRENVKRLEARVQEKQNVLEKNMQVTQTLLQRDVFGDALPWVIVVIVVVAGVAFASGYLVAD